MYPADRWLQIEAGDKHLLQNSKPHTLGPELMQVEEKDDQEDEPQSEASAVPASDSLEVLKEEKVDDGKHEKQTKAKPDAKKAAKTKCQRQG